MVIRYGFSLNCASEVQGIKKEKQNSSLKRKKCRIESINLRDRLKQMTEVLSLTIVQGLKACYHSNNDCWFTFNAILMF